MKLTMLIVDRNKRTVSEPTSITHRQGCVRRRRTLPAPAVLDQSRGARDATRASPERDVARQRASQARGSFGDPEPTRTTATAGRCRAPPSRAALSRRRDWSGRWRRSLSGVGVAHHGIVCSVAEQHASLRAKRGRPTYAPNYPPSSPRVRAGPRQRRCEFEGRSARRGTGLSPAQPRRSPGSAEIAVARWSCAEPGVGAAAASCLAAPKWSRTARLRARRPRFARASTSATCVAARRHFAPRARTSCGRSEPRELEACRRRGSCCGSSRRSSPRAGAASARSAGAASSTESPAREHRRRADRCAACARHGRRRRGRASFHVCRQPSARHTIDTHGPRRSALAPCRSASRAGRLQTGGRARGAIATIRAARRAPWARRRTS